jgi:hypothetical protein
LVTSLSRPARFPPVPRMLVKNLLRNSVLLHPHNMTQVLQPPLLYLRNELERPLEFVDLVIRPDVPLPLRQRSCEEPSSYYPLRYSKLRLWKGIMTPRLRP